jgi:hypothetical protein
MLGCTPFNAMRATTSRIAAGLGRGGGANTRPCPHLVAASLLLLLHVATPGPTSPSSQTTPAALPCDPTPPAALAATAATLSVGAAAAAAI